MKRPTGLHLALAVVLAANALALRHAAANRSGEPEAEIELTERELHYRGGNRDNSAVFLHLQRHHGTDAIPQSELAAAGFDLSVPANSPHARDYYGRQRLHRVFAAFEYDGKAWEAARQKGQYNSMESRLVFAGIARDAAILRTRFPDRHKVIILPAAMRILPAKEEVQGHLTSMPFLIQVPLPFSKGFENLPYIPPLTTGAEPRYKVRLRYGANFEPWVTAVEFTR